MKNEETIRVDSSDEIRERLDRLERAGVDIVNGASIFYAEGAGDCSNGVIKEAYVESPSLHFENQFWRDELHDAYWSDDMDMRAERMAHA